VTHKYGWGGEVQGGGAGQSSDIYYSYTGNRRDGFTYDAAGNLKSGGNQSFNYDATGQQTYAASQGGGGGAPSFTDEPLAAGQTTIKAVHVTELRSAINQVRAGVGLTAYSWQKPTASNGAINNAVLISWEPIDEMRTALNQALGAPSPAYAAGLAQGQAIRANHIQELRNRVTSWRNGQAAATLYQHYDGAGLRVKRTENGATTYYLRSSVLGRQIVAEINGSGAWQRGFVYAGSSLLAVQQGGVFWMHEDPVTKSKRVTDVNGTVVSAIELDPWGADTNRSSNAAFQPKKFTSYDRDANGSDEAMFRRFNRKHSRFDQPDPYDGSYSLTDPQSLNRYSYVQNDPVNFVDPSGLNLSSGGIGGGGFCWYISELINDRWTLVGVHCMDPGGGGGGGGDTGGGGGGAGGGKGDNPLGGTEGKATQQNLCDNKLASIFGGPGAVADTGRTPGTLLHPTAGMQRFPDHSAQGGVMHLYTNAQGTAATVGLYVPSGFSAVPGGSGTVYYPNRPGQVNAGQVNFNYSQYRNSAGITVSFVHIGRPAGPATNDFGSRRVGSIAGPNTGGDAKDGYNHTHINFYADFARGIRIDPRTLFCKEFGF
jgi:RHS repeat-associated protein